MMLIRPRELISQRRMMILEISGFESRFEDEKFPRLIVDFHLCIDVLHLQEQPYDDEIS